MTSEKLRVGLYAGVSTNDKGQNLEAQLLHLRKIADAEEYVIVEEYTDEASGKTVRGRSGYSKMMSDSENHGFDTIMT